MSRDYILTDEDGEQYSLDNMRTQSWLEGHVVGAEIIVNDLIDRAGKAFAAGDDARANMLREIARDIKERIVRELDTKAKEYEKQYPWRMGKNKAKKTQSKPDAIYD